MDNLFSNKEEHFGPIWFIPGKNKGRYPYCHSLYIEEDQILIDPSSNKKRLLELSKGPGVKEIWLSHAHEDHLMYLSLFKDKQIAMSKADSYALQDLEHLFDAYDVEEKDKPSWTEFFQRIIKFKPVKVDKYLKQNNELQLKSGPVKIIATPGHTPGNLSFYFKNQNLLFSGDYDLSDFGPWYGDANSCLYSTIDSVNKLSEINADTCIVSHEKGIFKNVSKLIWDNYLGVISERENKLLELLKTPKNIKNIISQNIVYGKPGKEKGYFDFGEKAIMTKHLDKLIKTGRVYKDREIYYKC